MTTLPQDHKDGNPIALLLLEFFRCFNESCAQLRTPLEYLAINETSYSYRGKIVICQYNANKPAKYGILYRSISDGHVPYTYYTLPYAGKPEEITDDSEYVTGTDNYTKYLVEGLEQHVNLQGQKISMDRYFTSMTLSHKIPRKPKHPLCI